MVFHRLFLFSELELITMPFYEYKSANPEDREKSCYTCRKPFELRRSIERAHDLVCPMCKNPLVKLISRVSQTTQEKFNSSKAKAAGFTVLNNVGDGVLEKE